MCESNSNEINSSQPVSNHSENDPANTSHSDMDSESSTTHNPFPVSDKEVISLPGQEEVSQSKNEISPLRCEDEELTVLKDKSSLCGDQTRDECQTSLVEETSANCLYQSSFDQNNSKISHISDSDSVKITLVQMVCCLLTIFFTILILKYYHY